MEPLSPTNEYHQRRVSLSDGVPQNMGSPNEQIVTAALEERVPAIRPTPISISATRSDGRINGEAKKVLPSSPVDDPELVKVRDWRHKLQRVFLSLKEPIMEEHFPKVVLIFDKLEVYDMQTEALQHSKIGKVMRHIAAIPDGKIPREDEYKFRPRAAALYRKWHTTPQTPVSAPSNNVPSPPIDTTPPSQPKVTDVSNGVFAAERKVPVDILPTNESNTPEPITCTEEQLRSWCQQLRDITTAIGQNIPAIRDIISKLELTVNITAKELRISEIGHTMFRIQSLALLDVQNEDMQKLLPRTSALLERWYILLAEDVPPPAPAPKVNGKMANTTLMKPEHDNAALADAIEDAQITKGQGVSRATSTYPPPAYSISTNEVEEDNEQNKPEWVWID